MFCWRAWGTEVGLCGGSLGSTSTSSTIMPATGMASNIVSKQASLLHPLICRPSLRSFMQSLIHLCFMHNSVNQDAVNRLVHLAMSLHMW